MDIMDLLVQLQHQILLVHQDLVLHQEQLFQELLQLDLRHDHRGQVLESGHLGGSGRARLGAQNAESAEAVTVARNERCAGVEADPGRAQHERVRGEALQVPGKWVLARLEVAHEANDELVLRRKVEDPLVVLDERAGLDDDRGRDGLPRRP